MTEREALKLALEALEDPLAPTKRLKAITAIKEALREHAMYEVQRLGQEIQPEPPQRTWVRLTDEEKKQIAKEANYNWEMTTGEYAERIGRLTEAKLKQKNGYAEEKNT